MNKRVDAMERTIRIARLLFAAFLVFWLPGLAVAADAAFVGKLALVTDPEVAKELGLSDDVKQKLTAMIDKREQEAIAVVSKLKGQPAAKQAEALAPFVADSEKLGKALLDDNQWAKLGKLKVAKDGMLGVLSPEIASKLQITDEQKNEINPLIDEYRRIMTSGSAFQKRVAPQSYERKIAGLLNDTQRGAWEQLSGVPAGGSGSAPAAGAAAAAPALAGGAAPAAGQGGINVQRAAGGSELTVAEDGKFKINFTFTPWKNVLEYFAQKGAYAFATDKWPAGTLNYSDPRTFTAEQVIDILNLHLMTKGFILVKREKLLRLFDVANDGPVPPEFVPEITAEDLANRGDFELVTVLFQLNRWPPSEADSEIRKRLGPYGSITVLSTARQLAVTELGGKLRWIKRTIDAVEQPDAPKDERFAIIKLSRLTPTEFLVNVRQLFGIPDGRWETPDGNLRLTSNELDGLVICNGKAPQVERLEKLAKDLDNAPSKNSSPGGITIIEQPQFASYPIMFADPAQVENVVRTLLAGSAPDLKVQLDPKSGKLNVWGRMAQHQAIQAILREMENQANNIEVVRLKKLNPQEAATALLQIVGKDPSGRAAANGFSAIPDAVNNSLTLSGTPSQVDAAKGWLTQMGENLGGGPGFVGRMPGMPEDRANTRVLPLSSRTVKHVLDQLPFMWDGSRANVRIEGANQPAPDANAPGRDSAPQRGEPRGTPRPASTAPKVKAAPPGDAKPFPQREQPALPAQPAPKKSDFTSAPEPSAQKFYFVSDPPSQIENTPGSALAAKGEPPASQPAASEPAPQAAPAAAGQETAPAPRENASAEIVIKVTPAGIIIQSEDLDALDEFQNTLQELVQADERRGKRMEEFPLKYSKADQAAVLLNEMISGQPNTGSSFGGNLAGNMLSGMGGGMGNIMGALLGGGGGAANVGGTVTSSSSGSTVTVTSDPRLNTLYVTAMPRDLDMVEQFLKKIDREESSDPPEGNKPRFIQVVHSKAADVAQLVREQYTGRIVGETNNRGGFGGGGVDPGALILQAALGGRGGPGGRGGFGGRGQQQSRGEEPKMALSVMADVNALVVTASPSLFEEVKAFVEAVDLENIIPDQTVRLVKLERLNADAAFNELSASLPGAQVVRALPFNSQQAAGRGGQNNQNQLNRNNTTQGNQQLSPQALARNQQNFQNFNQGRGGNQGGNNFGRGGQGNFGGGNLGGNNFGGGRGGQPGGGFGGGGNFGAGGRGGQPGGGGFQGGRGGQPGGGGFGGGGGQPGGGFGGGGGNRGGGGGPGGGRGGFQ